MKLGYMKSLFPLAIALVLTVSCGNDDSLTEQGNRSENTVTRFVAKASPITRTSGKYDGAGGLDFCWNETDRLWLCNPDAMPHWIRNHQGYSGSGFVPAGDCASSVSFYFPGTLTREEYSVRYTGESDSPDKVMIQSHQSQQKPNNATQLGVAGDCGVAIAKRLPTGTYSFNIAHKSAYATFLAYSAQGVAANSRLTKIRVKANQAIAGEFKLNDSGLDLNNRPVASVANRTIELALGGSGTDFTLPSSPDPSVNAATMVLAPGKYNITVEYTLTDLSTHQSTVITRNYSNLEFEAGLNKTFLVSFDMPIFYKGLYYMWDARQHYWFGFDTVQPTTKGNTNGNYPHDKASASVRWYNDVEGYDWYYGFPAVSASNSCADCPNVNELAWYALKGDPHWDDTTRWYILGHAYTGGIWLKKQTVIASENGVSLSALRNTAPDGKDLTHKTSFPGYDNWNLKKGRPSDISHYFFIPAMGNYFNGKFQDIGFHGAVWSSTPAPAGNNGAYGLGFWHGSVRVLNYNRDLGYPLLKRQ